jgi:hypothetical protein
MSLGNILDGAIRLIDNLVDRAHHDAGHVEDRLGTLSASG